MRVFDGGWSGGRSRAATSLQSGTQCSIKPPIPAALLAAIGGIREIRTQETVRGAWLADVRWLRAFAKGKPAAAVAALMAAAVAIEHGRVETWTDADGEPLD